MKRIIQLLVCILCFLFVIKPSASEELKKLKGGTGSRSTDSYTQDYSFSTNNPMPKIEAKTGTDNNKYLLYSFDNTNFTTDVGKPKIPYITQFVYLPANAENVTMTITDTSEQANVIASPIYPVEQSQFVTDANGLTYEQKTFTIDSNFYNTSQGYYPSVKAEMGKVTSIRGLHYLPVKIYPYQYDPSTKTLNHIENISFKISWTGHYSTNRALPSTYGNSFNTVIKGLGLHNFAQDLPTDDGQIGTVSRPGYANFSTGVPTDYLIITANNFYNSPSALDTLANYRASLAGGGYKVSIVQAQDIYNYCPGKTGSETQDQLIKLFIKYVYDHWNGTNTPVQFVLLVGDAITDTGNVQHNDPMVLIPTHIVTKSSGYATDYWLSCLDGSASDGTLYQDYYDMAGDVFIGRFPVQDSTQLQTVVDKTINFETSFPGNWRSNAGLLSGFINADTIYLPETKSMFQNIVNNDLTPAQLISKETYRTDFPDGSDGVSQMRSAIIDNFNNGNQITIVNTHGSKLTWGNTDGTTFCGSKLGGKQMCGIIGGTLPSDLQYLTNTSSPTILFNAACETGWFDNNNPDQESLGENVVEDSATGAVAFFGATRSLGDPIDIVQKTTDQIFFNKNSRLASAILQAKLTSTPWVNDFMYILNLLGDPALDALKMLQPVSKPDLTAQFISYDATAKDITFHTKVKNAGSASASNVLLELFTADPKAGGEVITSASISVVNANQEISQDITMSIPASWSNGTNLYLVVNSDNEIDELAEGNNTSTPLFVSPSLLPEIFIADGYSPDIQNNKIVFSNYNNIDLKDLGPDGKAETPDDYYAGTVVNLTNNLYTTPSSPSIYGGRVVWQSYDANSQSQIFVRDTLTDGEFDSNDLYTEITQHILNSNNYPAISTDKTVWVNKIANNIYYSSTGSNAIFDSTDIELPVSSNSLIQAFPDVDGNKIVWQQNGVYGETYVYLANLSNNTVSNIIPVTYGNHSSPKINQNKIVWVDSRGGPYNIYLYDLGPDGLYNTHDSGEGEYALTADSKTRTNPAIYGNKIIWQILQNGNYDFYYYDLGLDGRAGTSDDTPEKKIDLPPASYRSASSLYDNKFVYSANTNSSDNKVYMVNLDGINTLQYYVPQNFPTIQAAIDNALSGNVIHVMPGTYNEQLDFKGKNIYLLADKGPGVTTIQGVVGGKPTITFNAQDGLSAVNEGLSATLDGFNISNTEGSALLINGTSPTIKNCIITSTATNGIGVDITNGSPLLKNNKILNNPGYGIKVTGTFTGEISSNIITGNLNSGIYLAGASGTSLIHNNLINSNANYGIFIENTSATNSTINNNTLVSNTLGGIKLSSSSNVGIKNNIISSNGTYGIYALSSTGLSSTYNDIYNQTTNSSGVTDGTGVIHTDPKFDGSSNLLQSTSPCINTGDVALKDSDGTRLDMGAYFYPASSLAKNASFETDNGTDYFTDWVFDDNVTNNNLADGWTSDTYETMDLSVNYSGTKSLKINVTNNRGFSAQDIPILPNKKYHVSGYVKTDCVDSNCYGTILTECMDANHQNIWGYGSCQLNTKSSDIQRLYGDNDWTKVEFDVTADNPNAKYLRAMCYNTPNNPFENPGSDSPMGTGTVWCDSMSVTEVVP